MRKFSHRLVCLLLGLFLSCAALAADDVVLNPAHPERYVVVKGDTLWDISERFLRDPWLWPDVWYVNPQIANPHLIYPGDIISLAYVDGKPRLMLERGGVVRLSPEMRSSPVDSAIPAIPIDAIRPFLSRSHVLDPETLNNAPYVVAFGDEHMVGSTNVKAYVRAIQDEQHTRFDVVHPGGPYKDADTGEILGYQAQYVGDGELQRTGDPATVLLTRMALETVIGDRLLPTNDELALNAFYPKAPDSAVNGSIIAVLNGVVEIGQYNVVVLDRGGNDGLEPGDVLVINHRGRTVRDTVTGNSRDRVVLPDEPAGKLMVFRTFPRVSFALVMHATRSIHVLDRVVNP